VLNITRLRGCCAAVADAYRDAAAPSSYVRSTDILRDTVPGKNFEQTSMSGCVDWTVQRRSYLANARRRLTCAGRNSDVISCHVIQDLARVTSDRPLPPVPRDVITQRRLFSTAFLPSSRPRTTVPTGHKGAPTKYFICNKTSAIA